MEQGRFLIVTGMSGAGKTLVLRTLEDLNYFCVDNLPAVLLPKFAELCRQTPNRNAAMVVDARGGSFDKFAEMLEEMKMNGFHFEVLYMDASDETLIRRYKETRRRHPLEHGHNSLSASVALERKALTQVREMANQVFDTSSTSVAELKMKVRNLYGGEAAAGKMLIVVQSFGFKHGLPLDSDIVLDVRFLPNPFYEDSMKHLTGNDAPVCEFLSKYPQTFEFLKKECQMLDFLIPQYESEGKSQLVISVGCTGGQHRSVFIANKLYDYLRLQSYHVELIHRDLSKKA